MDPNKQNSHKQVHVLAQSSRFRFVYRRALVLLSLSFSRRLSVVISPPAPVIYLCITHTVQVPLAGCLSTIGPQHTDIWSGCISISQLSVAAEQKHSHALQVEHLFCHCVCLGVSKAKCVCWLLVPFGHLSYFRTLNSAVLLYHFYTVPRGGGSVFQLGFISGN